VWTGFICLRIGTLEHGNESSGSMKCWKVLESLSDWRLLNDLAQWSLLVRQPVSQLLRTIF
jgi:hypothetical protein